MSLTRIQFTTTLLDDKFQVEAQVILSVINKVIFYYKNTGTTELGPFEGVVDVAQLTKMPVWTGAALPTFAVPYVRHNIATRTFEDIDDVTKWMDIISSDVKALANEISYTEPVVTTYDITT